MYFNVLNIRTFSTALLCKHQMAVLSILATINHDDKHRIKTQKVPTFLQGVAIYENHELGVQKHFSLL